MKEWTKLVQEDSEIIFISDANNQCRIYSSVLCCTSLLRYFLSSTLSPITSVNLIKKWRTDDLNFPPSITPFEILAFFEMKLVSNPYTPQKFLNRNCCLTGFSQTELHSTKHHDGAINTSTIHLFHSTQYILLLFPYRLFRTFTDAEVQ